MTPTQQIAVFFSALVLASAGHAHAAFVDRTSGAYVNEGLGSPGVTDPFTQVDDAFRLVSISGGSITGGEGGNAFTLFVEYAGGGEEQIFQANIPDFSNFNLNTISDRTFTQGDVVGFRFVVQSGVNEARLNMDDVTYRFETADLPTGIPEPFSAALLGTGLLGLAWLRRRGA